LFVAVRRLLTGCFLLFVLVPAAEGVAAREPARLTYSLEIPLSGRPSNDQSFASGGLCLAGPTGAEGSRLTRPGEDSEPAWSPDGRRLAFTRLERTPGAAIIVRDERGRERMVAAFGNDSQEAAWSPDGKWIAFTAGAWGRTIYTIRPDGSDSRVLVPGELWVFPRSPAWSPDGRSLAFSENRRDIVTGLNDIYLIDRDGSNRRKLTENGSQPSWSPDGKSIVFVRDADLVAIGVDGRDERVLTSTPEREADPAWSPDGRWIAFEREGDILLVRPNGSGEAVVRGTALLESDPAWRPAAQRLPGKQRPCVIRGSSRADVLRGTSYSDLILSGGGRDSIFAGKGDDVVDAGPGPDRLFGELDWDLLNGGLGSDRIFGGAGNDSLASADGESDLLSGGRGRDFAYSDSVDRISTVERICFTNSC
jgi:dipeptidyl aminopeptidase/acylaminoacyl peptidase